MNRENKEITDDNATLVQPGNYYLSSEGAEHLYNALEKMEKAGQMLQTVLNRMKPLNDEPEVRNEKLEEVRRS
jgi:hypothetical protein